MVVKCPQVLDMLMWVLLGDYYSVTLPFYSVTLVGNLSLLPVKGIMGIN